MPVDDRACSASAVDDAAGEARSSTPGCARDRPRARDASSAREQRLAAADVGRAERGANLDHARCVPSARDVARAIELGLGVAALRAQLVELAAGRASCVGRVVVEIDVERVRLRASRRGSGARARRARARDPRAARTGGGARAGSCAVSASSSSTRSTRSRGSSRMPLVISASGRRRARRGAARTTTSTVSLALTRASSLRRSRTAGDVLRQQVREVRVQRQPERDQVRRRSRAPRRDRDDPPRVPARATRRSGARG